MLDHCGMQHGFIKYFSVFLDAITVEFMTIILHTGKEYPIQNKSR